MTENTAAGSTATAEPTTPAIAKSDLPALAQALIAAATPVRDEAVKISEEIKKGDNVGELLADAITKSKNKEVVANLSKIEQANDIILQLSKRNEELVRPSLKVPTDEELAKLETDFRAAAQQLNAYNNVFGNEVSRADNIPDDAKVSLFTYIGELPRGKRGARPGQGSGTARPRVKSVEYTHDLNGEKDFVKVGNDESSTFTHLAGVVKRETKQEVSAADFHEPWLAAYPAADGDWTKLPEVTTFVYSTTDANNKTHQYFVRVTK